MAASDDDTLMFPLQMEDLEISSEGSEAGSESSSLDSSSSWSGGESEAEEEGLVMKDVSTPTSRPRAAADAAKFKRPLPVSPRRRQNTFTASTFHDLYTLKDDILGRGASASVKTCYSVTSGEEFAVKIVEKRSGFNRGRVIKEIETFHLCSKHPNIVQLVEYFEEDDKFYMVFEKMHGGPLLNHIQRRIHFTEHEASLVLKDIVTSLKFLHDNGIAHRDVKPENILCTYPDKVCPVKLCDLDLASKTQLQSSNNASSSSNHPITTPDLQSPVGSAEFMAPEVVDAFVGDSLRYDKRCDMWSTGVILYIMLCGYPPFYGDCWRDNCGWDQGLPCHDCQEALFHRIQKGAYDFPAEDWDCVSDNAKDLIQHLLVKNVRQRYTADDVLAHPFILEDCPTTPLQTPNVLQRNESARTLTQLKETFNAASALPEVTPSTTPTEESVLATEMEPPTRTPTMPNLSMFAAQPPETESLFRKLSVNFLSALPGPAQQLLPAHRDSCTGAAANVPSTSSGAKENVLVGAN